MSAGQVADDIGDVVILGGAFWSLMAGIGLLRLPDVLTRMHAATKPQVLGLLMMLLGVALPAAHRRRHHDPDPGRPVPDLDRAGRRAHDRPGRATPLNQIAAVGSGRLPTTLHFGSLTCRRCSPCWPPRSGAAATSSAPRSPSAGRPPPSCSSASRSRPPCCCSGSRSRTRRSAPTSGTARRPGRAARSPWPASTEPWPRARCHWWRRSRRPARPSPCLVDHARRHGGPRAGHRHHARVRRRHPRLRPGAARGQPRQPLHAALHARLGDRLRPVLHLLRTRLGDERLRHAAQPAHRRSADPRALRAARRDRKERAWSTGSNGRR